MELTVLDRSIYGLKLYLKGIPLHVLNSIRRVAIAEVPTMAVDSVVFTVNSSVFYDEYVAHRLGLIPLTSEEALDKYKSPEECAEAGDKGIFSEDCFAKLELEGRGREDEVVTLYSDDLRTSDPSVKPVFSRIPIIALGKNQEIRLEAYARLGRGREHAKWSPVSVATHKYVPDIRVDPEKCVGSSCNACIDVCPKGIFQLVDDKISIRVERLLDCTLCRLCEINCPYGVIRIGYKENEYIFNIESTGSLSPKRILLEAVKILENKLDDFVKTLEKEGVL